MYSSETYVTCQTTKQLLSNFEPLNLENISYVEGLGLTLVDFLKKCNDTSKNIWSTTRERKTRREQCLSFFS